MWRVWRVRGAVCVTTRLCMALLGEVAARGSGERGVRRSEARGQWWRGGLSEALATGSFNSGSSARSASAACRPCTRAVIIDTAKEAQLVRKEQR